MKSNSAGEFIVPTGNLLDMLDLVFVGDVPEKYIEAAGADLSDIEPDDVDHGLVTSPLTKRLALMCGAVNQTELAIGRALDQIGHNGSDFDKATSESLWQVRRTLSEKEKTLTHLIKASLESEFPMSIAATKGKGIRKGWVFIGKEEDDWFASFEAHEPCRVVSETLTTIASIFEGADVAEPADFKLGPLTDGDDVCMEITDRRLMKLVYLERTLKASSIALLNYPAGPGAEMNGPEDMIKWLCSFSPDRQAEILDIMERYAEAFVLVTDIFWSCVYEANPELIDFALGLREGWKIIKSEPKAELIGLGVIRVSSPKELLQLLGIPGDM